MADSPTDRNRFRKQEVGAKTNAWGGDLNEDGGSDRIDESVDGWTEFTLSGSKTLTSVNYETDEARKRVINVTGGTGGTVTIPSVEKWYLVRNGASGSVVITNGSNSVSLPAGEICEVLTNGTAIYKSNSKDYVDSAILNASLSADIPSQAGNAGKYIQTNGTIASWEDITTADVFGLDTELDALQPLDADLTTIAALTPSNDDVMQRKAGAWAARTMAQFYADIGTAGLTAALALKADLTAVNGAQQVFIPASAMTARTTNGAAVGLTESATNKIMSSTLDFDAATDEFAQFRWKMPKRWDEGTVTAKFIWTATNTGNVIWGLQGVALSDDDVLDTAFGTAQAVTDGVTATTDVMISAATAAVTIGGTPAEGDFVVFQVYRDANDAADTCAVDAKLLGVELTITTNAAIDS